MLSAKFKLWTNSKVGTQAVSDVIVQAATHRYHADDAITNGLVLDLVFGFFFPFRFPFCFRFRFRLLLLLILIVIFFLCLFLVIHA
jgi:hypothetical protein